MTKKSESKATVKGADAEKKILKKIQDGTAKAQKEAADKKGGKENKVGEKRTWQSKEQADGKPKAGKGGSAQPVLNRRQKQKVSDLIKKLRVSTYPCPISITNHVNHSLLLDLLQSPPYEEEGDVW